MSESAWKWGGYRRGMGKEGDDPRIVYAVRAIKQELAYNGLGGVVNLETDTFGGGTERAVKKFQKSVGLPKDGVVGAKTANALWEMRIFDISEDLGIPDGWLRAQVHWESADDPGAQFTNPDGSRDRGLIQLNTRNNPDDDQVFTPEWSLGFLGRFQDYGAKQYRDCEIDKWRLAVGRWRSPVGADEWCEDPTIQPDQDGTWGEKVAFYVGRVDTWGRLGWV